MVAVAHADRRSDGSAVRAAAPAWASVTAWGAGLLAIALGAGAVSGGATPAAITAGAALAVVGLAALIWGGAVLARGRIVTPRSGIAGALAGIVVATLGVAAEPAKVSVLTAAAASVLFVAIAAACGAKMRSAARHREGEDAASPRIAVLLIAAVVVAGIVTPALGATEAARLAPDHGSHGIVEPGHH